MQKVKLAGKPYVLIEREEYDRLRRLAKVGEMPALPQRGADGTYPAIAYGRASIARGVVRDRLKLGLKQKELADLAGIRVETLSRIESGRHTPGLATIEKIDAALKAAGRKKRAKAG